jgi:hypothetical protein
MAQDDAEGWDAFISYSRRDKAFVVRLAAALNAYRPPRTLGAQARPLRVFLDQNDLGAGDYAPEIEAQLARSRMLIVVCTPAARASPYVDDEVRRFVRLREPDAVVPGEPLREPGTAVPDVPTPNPGAGVPGVPTPAPDAVVPGVPTPTANAAVPRVRLRASDAVVPVLLAGLANNEAAPAQAAEMAFPPALADAMQMPLAVDYRGFDARRDRVQRGGFEGPWHQLLAKLYGVARAEIEQREKRRQLVRWRWIGGSAAVLVAVLASALVLTLLARAEAERQRDLAEQRRRDAQARALNVRAEASLADGGQGLQRALLLTVESLASAWTPEAQALLLAQLDRLVAPPIAAVSDQRGPILSLVAMPALGLVASQGGDRLVLRSLSDLRPVRELAAPRAPGAVRRLVLSPDGRWLLAGCAEQAACVWDTGSWTVAWSPQPHAAVTAAAFSPDSRRLAYAHEGPPRVMLVGTDTWQPMEPLPIEERNSAPIQGLGFGGDADTLLVRTRSDLELHDLRTRTKLQEVDTRGGTAFVHVPETGAVFVDDASRRLRALRLTRDAGGAPRLSEPGEPLGTPLDSRAQASASRDGRTVATRTADRMVQLTAPEPGVPARHADGGSAIALAGPAVAARASASAGTGAGAESAVGSRATSDAGTGTGASASASASASAGAGTEARPGQATPTPTDVGAAAGRPATWLIVGTQDGRIELSDLRPAAAQRLASAAADAQLTHLALSRDGQQLAVTDDTGATRVRAAADGRVLTTLPALEGARPLFSADGRWLFVVASRAMAVYASADWRPVWQTAGDESLGGLWLTPDGRWLLLERARQLERIALPEGRAAPPIALTESLSELRAEPGGQRVAGQSTAHVARGLGLRQPTIRRVWQIDDGRAWGWRSFEQDDLARLQGIGWGRRADDAQGEWTRVDGGGDRALVDAAAAWPLVADLLSPPEPPAVRWLSEPDAAGTALHVHALRRAERALGSPATPPAWSADGGWLAVLGEDGAVHRWSMSPAGLAAEACSRLRRNLGPGEWRTAFGDEGYRRTCPALPEGR